MNKKMNKWMINSDGFAIWSYHFPLKELELIIIGYQSKLFQIRKLGVEKYDDFSIDGFLESIDWKKNKTKLFPKIDTSLLSEDLILGDSEYYFSFTHYFYYNNQVVQFEVSYKSILDILNHIKYPTDYIKKWPLIYFNTGCTINKDLEIIEYDLTLHLNSDIMLNSLPCNHCNNQIDYQEIMEKGLESVKKYWQDNTELSEKNLKPFNSFMQSIGKYVKSVGGYIDMNEGGKSLYENIITEKGIYHSHTA
jgi:hypothetical protein